MDTWLSLCVVQDGDCGPFESEDGKRSDLVRRVVLIYRVFSGVHGRDPWFQHLLASWRSSLAGYVGWKTNLCEEEVLRKGLS